VKQHLLYPAQIAATVALIVAFRMFGYEFDLPSYVLGVVASVACSSIREAMR